MTTSDSAFHDTSPEGEPPLDVPHYGAPLGVALGRYVQKYATYSGRASRSEFWWCALVLVVINTGLNLVYRGVGGLDTAAEAASPTPAVTVVFIVSLLWALLTISPTLALTVRRLHDTDLGGGWALLLLIPLAGVVAVGILCARRSNPDGARFDFRREN